MTTGTKQTLSQIDDELEDISQETQDQPAVTKEVPEKFKGKSTEDIINAYVNLEKEYGRKANDIGELRRLTDELLGLQLKKEIPVEKHKPLTSEELFENPDKAINDVVTSHPRIRELESEIKLGKIESARKVFEDKHSDWRGVMGSQDFQDWIGSSSVRTRMLHEADKNYDYSLGDELLTLYKEIKQVDIKKRESEVEEKTSKDLKNSMTEKGSTGATSKKVYRRNDLIELKLRNPQKYEAMEDQIMLAYKEGRVK